MERDVDCSDIPPDDSALLISSGAKRCGPHRTRRSTLDRPPTMQRRAKNFRWSLIMQPRVKHVRTDDAAAVVYGGSEASVEDCAQTVDDMTPLSRCARRRRVTSRHPNGKCASVWSTTHGCAIFGLISFCLATDAIIQPTDCDERMRD